MIQRLIPALEVLEVVAYLIDFGRVNMPEHAGLRMEERNITGGEILAALRSGVLCTDSRVAGKWRYLARKNEVEFVSRSTSMMTATCSYSSPSCGRTRHEVHRMR